MLSLQAEVRVAGVRWGWKLRVSGLECGGKGDFWEDVNGGR